MCKEEYNVNDFVYIMHENILTRAIIDSKTTKERRLFENVDSNDTIIDVYYTIAIIDKDTISLIPKHFYADELFRTKQDLFRFLIDNAR